MEVLDGKKVREEILEELKNKFKNLNLTLAVLQIGEDAASSIYIGQKEKMCNYLGINFKHYNLEDNVKEDDVIDLINKLNNDKTTGILLQLPIPKHLNEQRILNTIDYKKDVDGLTNANVANLVLNGNGLVPCTPKGVMTILKQYNIDLNSKKVVIIGRSNLVGKPLFNLMLNENATVTLCHSKTKNLKEHTLNADIVVAAVGKPKFVTEDMISDGTVVIDVGISRVNGKVVGDVDYENVKNKVSFITPVPGGVGPMTIASLAENVYEAYLLQNK